MTADIFIFIFIFIYIIFVTFAMKSIANIVLLIPTDKKIFSNLLKQKMKVQIFSFISHEKMSQNF